MVVLYLEIVIKNNIRVVQVHDSMPKRSIVNRSYTKCHTECIVITINHIALPVGGFCDCLGAETNWSTMMD